MLLWWSCLGHLHLPGILWVIIYGWWGGLEAFAFGNSYMQLIQHQHDNEAGNQNSSKQAVRQAFFSACSMCQNAGMQNACM